jgi:hypothetical protein
MVEITASEINHVLSIAHEAQNIRIGNNGNSFEWDEPQAPGVKFSTQRLQEATCQKPKQ